MKKEHEITILVMGKSGSGASSVAKLLLEKLEDLGEQLVSTDAGHLNFVLSDPDGIPSHAVAIKYLLALRDHGLRVIIRPQMINKTASKRKSVKR